MHENICQLENDTDYLRDQFLNIKTEKYKSIEKGLFALNLELQKEV